MSNVNWKKLLDCSLGIAVRLLQNGAEISRVEETVINICEAYGATSVDVFAIPSKVEATIEIGDEYFTTKIRRIYNSNLDLGNIETLNELTEYICKNKPDTSEIYEKIRAFDKQKESLLNTILKYIAVFIGCGAFAIMYGGSIRDGLASGIAALVMALVLSRISSLGNYKLFNTLILSIIGGFLSVGLYYIHIGEHISYIMIGAIMYLIPGKEFGIAFRELLMRDIISGAIRLFQSIIIALAIVIGFSIPIAIFNYSMDFYKFHNEIITVISSIFGCTAFALIFGSKKRRLPFIAIGSALVTTVFVILNHYEFDLLVSIFISQIVGAIYSEVVAKFIKSPTIVLLLTTNLALVPGGLLYYTIYGIWNNDASAKTHLMDVLNSSIAIGAAILVIAVISGMIRRLIEHYKKA